MRLFQAPNLTKIYGSKPYKKGMEMTHNFHPSARTWARDRALEDVPWVVDGRSLVRAF